MIGDARPARAHAPAVASPERRAVRLRRARSRARSGRTARARSCAASSPAPQALGYEFKIGCELEYFLVRRREDGGIELADPLDTLDQPCYDMRALTRNLDFVSTLSRYVNALGWDNYATDHEDANGQFEQNFEFADALTHCDRAIFFRYMVEAHGAGARAARDVHAQAVRAPDRQRLPLPHEPVGRTATNAVRPIRPTTRTASGCRELGVPLHRRPEGAREGVHRGDGADRQRPTSACAVGAPTSGADVGAGLHHLRLQQPHADAAHPGAGADRGPHGGRLVQPVPGDDRRCWRPGLDGIEHEHRPGRRQRRANLYELSAARAAPSWASSCCRPTCSTRRASSSEDDVHAHGARARPATRTTSTTSSKIKRDEWQRLPRADHAVGARPLPAAVLEEDDRHVRNRGAVRQDRPDRRCSWARTSSGCWCSSTTAGRTRRASPSTATRSRPAGRS